MQHNGRVHWEFWDASEGYTQMQRWRWLFILLNTEAVLCVPSLGWLHRGCNQWGISFLSHGSWLISIHHAPCNAPLCHIYACLPAHTHTPTWLLHSVHTYDTASLFSHGFAHTMQQTMQGCAMPEMPSRMRMERNTAGERKNSKETMGERSLAERPLCSGSRIMEYNQLNSLENNET